MSTKRAIVVADGTISEESAARKNIQRRRLVSCLIKATEQLIRDEGLSQITIRKIGNIAGYSSATIYCYFEDVNELILFASVRYLREYVRKLSTEDLSGLDAKNRYIHVTRLFSGMMFENPEVFYNMFFGRHQDQLNAVIREYYDLFPEEISSISSDLKKMIMQGSLYERQRHMIEHLLLDGFLHPGTENIVLELIIRLQQSFLSDLKERTIRETASALDRFMALFIHILESNKN